MHAANTFCHSEDAALGDAVCCSKIPVRSFESFNTQELCSKQIPTDSWFWNELIKKKPKHAVALTGIADQSQISKRNC